MRILHFVISSIAVLFLGACTNQEVENELHEYTQKAYSFCHTQTRATDTSFEEGDVIGLYAVKRVGASIGAMQASGNFADNKKYIYRAGNFVPAGNGDIIYPPTGEKVDFYAYYPYQSSPNPLDLCFDSSVGQSSGGSYKFSDHLWAKSENGYINSKTPIALPFTHVQGLVEVAVNKNGVDAISGAKVVAAMVEQRGQLQSGVLHISSNTLSPISMLLYKETDTQYIFRALVPGGNIFSSGKDAFYFTLASGVTKKFISSNEFPVQSGRTTRFDLNFPADVITWEYSFTATPTFMNFNSKGQIKSFTITSVRRKVINGIPTSTVEDVSWSGSITGADAAAFNLSGTSVITQENSTPNFKDATLTITQSGSGKTITITLEQDSGIEIDTEI